MVFPTLHLFKEDKIDFAHSSFPSDTRVPTGLQACYERNLCFRASCIVILLRWASSPAKSLNTAGFTSQVRKHLHLCLVDVLLLQEGFASLGLALPAASRQHSCFRNTCERSLTAADLETPQRSWGKVRVQVSSNIKRSDHFHCRFTRLQEEQLVGSQKTKSPCFLCVLILTSRKPI